jgi:hypothetical protein
MSPFLGSVAAAGSSANLLVSAVVKWRGDLTANNYCSATDNFYAWGGSKPMRCSDQSMADDVVAALVHKNNLQQSEWVRF